MIQEIGTTSKVLFVASRCRRFDHYDGSSILVVDEVSTESEEHAVFKSVKTIGKMTGNDMILWLNFGS